LSSPTSFFVSSKVLPFCKPMIRINNWIFLLTKRKTNQFTR
jgi:hypothetical protein